MLEHLKIEELILIKKASIAFGEGFNILTGETGSGKSAILSAIRLILGMRADPDLIRKGASQAVIEAKVRILRAYIDEDGFELAPNDPFLVRRELYLTGKSRAFVNDQLVSITQLRKIFDASIELVDQDSSHLISAPAAQRRLLDLWCGIETSALEQSYALIAKLASDLTSLQEQQKHAYLALEKARDELQELEEINLQQGEEETLAAEHHLLTHAEESIRKLSSIQEHLSGSSVPLAALLNKLGNALERHNACLDASKLLLSASIEVGEAAELIAKAIDSLESDPKRLEKVEQRIGKIEKLKRRFGMNFEEIEQAKAARKRNITSLEALEDRSTALQEILAHERKNYQTLSQKFSILRQSGAKELEGRLVDALRSLNLPYARCALNIEQKEPGPFGTDEVRILFSANPGHPLLPLEECASGGEQSRLLFAFKLLFSDKERCSCLIFDELDSNVGGHTASILGKQLRRLALSRQIICITHFVQVARHATHHYLVQKSQAEETFTTVQQLNALEREVEYARMTGASPVLE